MLTECYNFLMLNTINYISKCLKLTFKVSGEDIDPLNINLIQSSIFWIQTMYTKDEFSADLTQRMLIICFIGKWNHNTILWQKYKYIMIIIILFYCKIK